jgi:hypothetical protein
VSFNREEEEMVSCYYNHLYKYNQNDFPANLNFREANNLLSRRLTGKITVSVAAQILFCREGGKAFYFTVRVTTFSTAWSLTNGVFLTGKKRRR